MKKIATKVIEVWIKVLETITGMCAFIMMVTIFWQVFTRFVLKVPAVWTEEVARYSFIYMALFGAAVAVKKNAHFGMTLLTDELKGKVRNLYMEFVVNTAVFISAIIMTISGWKFAIEFGLRRVSPTFLIPMTWIFIAIPIMGVSMMAFSLYNILFEDYSEEVSFEEELRNQERDLGDSSI